MYRVLRGNWDVYRDDPIQDFAKKYLLPALPKKVTSTLALCFRVGMYSVNTGNRMLPTCFYSID